MQAFPHVWNLQFLQRSGFEDFFSDNYRQYASNPTILCNSNCQMLTMDKIM